MPNAIWRGHISFGLVTIPVAVHAAQDTSSALRFKQLDGRDHAPIHQKRVNERTGDEVAWEHVVKGYPTSDGAFIVLSDDELRAANPKVSQTIDIIGTVCADDVDVVFYDKPYYLVPQPGGAKAYALLREALRQMGRAAIVRFVLRTKGHVALLLPRGDAIVLELLRYAHELRGTEALDLPSTHLADVGVTDAELQMARMLLDSIAAPWDPEAYRDEYHDAVLELIEHKAATGEVTAPPPAVEESGGEVVDIMALLKASIARTSASA